VTALSAAAPGRPQAVAPLGGSFAPVVVASLVLHIMIFAGIPLAARLLYRSTVYERPKTFTLVNMPVQVVQAVKRAAQNKPKATTPVPAKKRARSAAKTEDKPEEKKDDLNELLDAIPASVSDISAGQSFKYAWYLNSVISKVEENWKPPMGLTDRKDAAATVQFTILSSGEISGVSITGSSGSSTLDNLAAKAVKAAAPFGKLPVGFQGDRLDIKYVLHYVKQ
jgi:TonB family protein